MARRARFHGPAANSPLGEALLDVIGLVAAVGFAAEVSQCLFLCGLTFRAGDRGATNDMLVQSLRRQCGAREARAAAREDFAALLRENVNRDETDEVRVEGTTQLIRAAQLNNLPRVLQLVQLGAPLDAVDASEQGCSALHWACIMGHEHVARALLDGKYGGRGAAADLPCAGNASTPLALASIQGSAAVVGLLLRRGARQELQNREGATALHMAVLLRRAEIVELLCAAPGAAAALALSTRQTFLGGLGGHRTPLSLAVGIREARCEAVLRAHGAHE